MGLVVCGGTDDGRSMSCMRGRSRRGRGSLARGSHARLSLVPDVPWAHPRHTPPNLTGRFQASTLQTLSCVRQISSSGAVCHLPLDSLRLKNKRRCSNVSAKSRPRVSLLLCYCMPMPSLREHVWIRPRKLAASGPRPIGSLR